MTTGLQRGSLGLPDTPRNRARVDRDGLPFASAMLAHLARRILQMCLGVQYGTMPAKGSLPNNAVQRASHWLYMVMLPLLSCCAQIEAPGKPLRQSRWLLQVARRHKHEDQCIELHRDIVGVLNREHSERLHKTVAT